MGDGGVGVVAMRSLLPIEMMRLEFKHNEDIGRAIDRIKTAEYDYIAGAGADPSLVVDPDTCVHCALSTIFASYLYSEERIIPPDALRHALAILYKDDGRFQVRLVY
jgi:hypothetical protein